MPETRIFYNAAGKWTIFQWGRAMYVASSLAVAVDLARRLGEPNEHIRILPGY